MNRRPTRTDQSDPSGPQAGDSTPHREVLNDDHLAFGYADLPTASAIYDPAQDKIVLSGDLVPLDQIIVVAHELAHRRARHVRSGWQPLDFFEEWMANLDAARSLIPFERLLRLLPQSSDLVHATRLLGVDFETLGWRICGLDRRERGQLERRLRAAASTLLTEKIRPLLALPRPRSALD